MTAMPETFPRRWVREPVPVHFPVDELVPETKEHLELRTALYQILKLGFADRALIGSDQFVYWDPTDPSACLAPDVFVRLGGPDETFDCWKVWERGAPHLAIEVVSRSDARDVAWDQKLAKYRRLGVRELLRFDPADREHPLRVWDSVQGDLVERLLLSPDRAECPTLELHWAVVRSAGQVSLRLARDAEGRELLPTPVEEAARERERAAAALARVRELEAALKRR